METVYKLTDENMRTYGGCQWKLGETKTVSGEGNLCGPGWLHAYTDPLLAVLLNPIHAKFSTPRLFRAETPAIGKTDHGLKIGVTSLILIEEIPVQVVTTEQRVRFAIYCALEVYRDPRFKRWAENWLSGKDRAAAAAGAARAAEAEAAEAAAAEAAAAAAWAAEAAEAAAWAARAAARAAWAAARAAWAAEAVAEAAEAAATKTPLNLIDLAKRATEEK